jgi:hypothetical protein
MTGVTLTLAISMPAQAVPTYCTATVSGNTATAYCYASASGSQFRAMARCRYVTPSGSNDYNTWYGLWRVQGDPQYSSATCGTGWSLYQPDAQVA